MKNKLLLAVFIFCAYLSFALSPASDGSQTTSDKTLCGAYKTFFPIGAAVSPNLISTQDTILLLKHYNSITAENSMKPGVIHPAADRWNWSGADKLVDFAVRHGLKMRGHCLVWHQQAAEWMFRDGDKPASKELLLARMKEHIQAVVGRYKGKIYCWDVVNEAVDDDSSRLYREKESKWYQICGEEFIARAFEYAHEADPGAVLFYNDYNAERPEKRERIYRMLKSLVDKGVPVHGMGLQGHWSLFEPSENELRTAIRRYASLGLQIQVTELDMSVYRWEKQRRSKNPGEDDSLSDQKRQQQNDQYAMIFRVLRDAGKSISGVTFWGVADNRTWLDFYPVAGRKNYPLLFDRELKPKEAFFRVVDF